MTNLFEVSTTFRSYFTNYTWFFLHYVATEGEAQSSMTYQHFYCNRFEQYPSIGEFMFTIYESYILIGVSNLNFSNGLLCQDLINY